MLFILVFGLSLGGRIKQIEGVDYERLHRARPDHDGDGPGGLRQQRLVDLPGALRPLRERRPLGADAAVADDARLQRRRRLPRARHRRLAAGALRSPLVGVPVRAAVRADRGGRASGWSCSARSAWWSGSTPRPWDHTTFIANIVILPLAFVGGVFYSVDMLPSPWHELSHVNPVFYLVNAVRFGFLGDSDVSVWLSLGVTAALAIPAYLWSQWLFTTGSARLEAQLAALERRVVRCRRCPRLVEWRERVAREKRAAFADEEYWGRPVPGFGDPRRARVRARPGPRRARRQPHGPRLHRRPLGRLAVRARSTAPASPTSRPRCIATTACALTAPSSPPRCAARRRPTSRCRPSATTACPTRREELELIRPSGDRLPRRVRLGRRAAAFSRLRPRPRFGHGAEHRVDDGPRARRLLPPEPAEHLHRAS